MINAIEKQRFGGAGAPMHEVVNPVALAPGAIAFTRGLEVMLVDGRKLTAAIDDKDLAGTLDLFERTASGEGRPVNVNPRAVMTAHRDGDKSCRVCLQGGHALVIALALEDMVERIEKALKRKN